MIAPKKGTHIEMYVIYNDYIAFQVDLFVCLLLICFDLLILCILLYFTLTFNLHFVFHFIQLYLILFQVILRSVWIRVRNVNYCPELSYKRCVRCVLWASEIGEEAS